MRLRWLRWCGAMTLIAGAATLVRSVARRVGPDDESSWLTLLGDDLRVAVSGEMSTETVLRGVVIVMIITLGWITTSLLAMPITCRRRRSRSRPLPRWSIWFVWGGAVLTSTIGTTGVSASSSPVTTEVRDEAAPPIVVRDSSELQLIGTAVVSGLVGAGLAARLRARDHRFRRSDDMESVNDPADSIPSDDLRQQLRRAEAASDDVATIVRRIRRVAPSSEIRHVIDQNDGWYVVEFTDPVKAIPSTQWVNGRSVRVRPDQLGSDDESFDSPTPLMMHVGRTVIGDVWVCLDTYRDFAVDCSSDEGERVWQHLRDALVWAPTSESRGLVSDVDLQSPGPRRTYRVGDRESVSDGARRVGESIAVIDRDEEPSTTPVLRRISHGVVESGLVRSDGQWRLVPVDVAIRPVGIGVDDEIRRIRELLGEPLPSIELSGVETPIESAVESLGESFDFSPEGSGDRWMFMASVLGPPQVVDRRYEPVQFERGKAEELVIWLAFHPRQRKRSLARTALWLTPVQDATFSNITAAARRSLNSVAAPPDDQAWVGITMSDDLPLADGFVTDVDVLRDAVEWARRRPEDHGLDRLRDALRLVRGVPFAGSTYTWSDGIGMSGDAATLVVRAASMMAEMCQEAGDMGGMYWATAKGLLALPGHEELVAIRLRAHAEHGDQVAMRAEWESYRRALACEWGDTEPSAKMMELWRRLVTARSVEQSEETADRCE